ncbi:MAG: DEAD/DEAH box helicase, partial [bacterium]
ARLRELVEDAAAHKLEVFYAGGRVRSTGAFTAVVESGIDWFDLSIAVDDAADLDMPELLAALRAGRPLVRLSDGTTVMIPPWLERRAAALTAAPLEGSAVRFRKAEALLLATVVDAASAAEVDAGFAKVRERLELFTGMTPRAAPRGFGATLRDYQRDGLGWLHFLRELGLGGCLADDMGLGKTVQVLALLDHLRVERARRRGGSIAHTPDGARKPSLVVAPRSLVFHWLDEARRFAPKLAMLEWHGPVRGQRAAELGRADVIVTTYATLRLDRERLAAIDYAIVVLDEAHAIKNAATASAQAARALRADRRLALTGTPVENRLDDLASIFDFLNPGLLGRTAVLRAIGDAPIERDPAAPFAEEAKLAELSEARALGRILRPFLMRRTKQQVLTELPPKTECIVSCRLEDAERRRYDELRDHYRRALLPAVERDGVGRNAIVVLEALLRLRQAALHPGLLDARRTDADSAKLDALVERLRAAIASGHQALVFSQFTTLLGIAMARLGREGIAYEYLDGKTRDRRERIAAFQAGSAPVFLLSLKAGGVGLNLTAADHVFLLDPWWNPAVEAQAIDRVHRIGQGRPVTAYRLIAEDTVEAKILALQAHKRALFDRVFDETGIIANLSVEQLRTLLE